MIIYELYKFDGSYNVSVMMEAVQLKNIFIEEKLLVHHKIFLDNVFFCMMRII